MNYIKNSTNQRILLLSILFILMLPQLYAEIDNADYTISDSKITKQLKIGRFEDVFLTLTNKQPAPITVLMAPSGNITPYLRLEDNRINVEPEDSIDVKLPFFANDLGIYTGSVVLTGAINEELPVTLIVSDQDIPVSAVVIRIDPLTRRVDSEDVLKYKVDIQNVLLDEGFDISVEYSINNFEKTDTFVLNQTFLEEYQNLTLNKSLSVIRNVTIPHFLKPGEYVISVKANYFGLQSSQTARFFITDPFLDRLILGIFPIKYLLLGLAVLTIVAGIYLIVKRQMAKKKRYKGSVDFKALQKPGDRVAFVGKIAETNHKAYFHIDQLTTHTLIAGSTGGGKTVSAEVLVEEALKLGVNIIVFDPTAQWSGFLRKNTQKKMFDLYPGFGMKKTQARNFNGNVRQIMDAREIIDIKRYMNPGEIQVFTINKLDPKDADVLVANTIREVFHANLDEQQELKTLIIFDEVHRLLPKFGGTGQGFIQIERGVREFRKWGVGLFLISQVLKDFIGETKANINTEIQMRTRDAGDLERIKNKYGAYMLQSLLKSATGIGMMENAQYNNGNPFFVHFRPLLHEHARLTDDELTNYNKYNEMVDDLDDEIRQLKEEGIDIFDLKLELKMALDKVKSGSFNMVDIYLEGLKPRLETHWKKLGKKPKKRVIKLVSEEQLQAEFEAAKKEREKQGGKAMEQAEIKKVELPELQIKEGMKVTTPRECIDAVNTLDDAEFAKLMENNPIPAWIGEADKELGEKLKEAKTKDDIIAAIEDKFPT